MKAKQSATPDKWPKPCNSTLPPELATYIHANIESHVADITKEFRRVILWHIFFIIWTNLENDTACIDKNCSIRVLKANALEAIARNASFCLFLIPEDRK